MAMANSKHVLSLLTSPTPYRNRKQYMDFHKFLLSSKDAFSCLQPSFSSPYCLKAVRLFAD